MRENDYKPNQPAEAQNLQDEGGVYQIDKTTQRILAVGATVSIVMLSLGVVVWSLGQINLSLELKRGA